MLVRKSFSRGVTVVGVSILGWLSLQYGSVSLVATRSLIRAHEEEDGVYYLITIVNTAVVDQQLGDSMRPSFWK